MHPLVNGRRRRTLLPVSQPPTPRPVSANVSFSAISHETTLQHWFPASQPHAGLKVKTGHLHHCQTVSVYSNNVRSSGQLFHPAQPGNSEMDDDCCCSGLLILMDWSSTRILGIASRRTTSHRSRGISIMFPPASAALGCDYRRQCSPDWLWLVLLRLFPSTPMSSPFSSAWWAASIFKQTALIDASKPRGPAAAIVTAGSSNTTHSTCILCQSAYVGGRQSRHSGQGKDTAFNKHGGSEMRLIETRETGWRWK
ncbi:hypothetical protein CKAH01_02163 [Colletotrichum kahawae]|uniref:Uncharacterized protein n=1 Tax=Colletotrichum kahawae TaxID=34407 RepID=A0AAD9Y284_COLKA|nr:hypothetical protein CKAH01_02163 [Colletotrichum kahawae]